MAIGQANLSTSVSTLLKFHFLKRLPLESSPLGSGAQNQLACGKGQKQNQMDLELLVNVPSKGTLTDMFHGCTVLGRPRGPSEVVQLFTLSQIFPWLHPVPHVLLLGGSPESSSPVPLLRIPALTIVGGHS